MSTPEEAFATARKMAIEIFSEKARGAAEDGLLTQYICLRVVLQIDEVFIPSATAEALISAERVAKLLQNTPTTSVHITDMKEILPRLKKARDRGDIPSYLAIGEQALNLIYKIRGDVDGDKAD